MARVGLEHASLVSGECGHRLGVRPKRRRFVTNAITLFQQNGRISRSSFSSSRTRSPKLICYLSVSLPFPPPVRELLEYDLSPRV